MLDVKDLSNLCSFLRKLITFTFSLKGNTFVIGEQGDFHMARMTNFAVLNCLYLVFDHKQQHICRGVKNNKNL